MLKSTIKASLVILAMQGTALAAGSLESKWEFGPYFGVRFSDHYRPLNVDQKSPLVGLRLGYFFTEQLAIEPSIQRAFGQNAAGVDANMDAIRLNVTNNFRAGHKFRPFLTAGFGLEVIDVGAVNEKNFAPNGGAGFRYLIGDFAGIRVDGRYIPTKVGGVVDKWEHNFEAAASLFFLLGGKKEEPKPTPTPEPTAVPAPIDTDGDGVTDEKDQCPATPAGLAVDEKGCPVMADSDGDGVADETDKCPATPAGTTVDATGCPAPLDSDGDGVMDDKDQCAGTPAGSPVDDTGCRPKEKTVRGALKGVEFVIASAKLTDNAKKVLDEAAVVLSQYAEGKVEVQGHSDSVGDINYNTKLSQDRAQSVVDYLASKGLDKGRFTAKGYGPTVPVASNKTKQGRQQNRRVELKWLDQ